ncbi:MAG: hypothetical protein ACOYJH_01075 [Anaerovoracaceae bacterium]|jgi:hypothetical protein
MERKINVRNAAVVNNVKSRTADAGLNRGALVSFISAVLAALSLAVVSTPAAVAAYTVMAIVSAFVFEGFVDAEIRNRIKDEKNK